MILVGDIYSSALWDRNVAAWVTPVPRVTGTRETLGGIDMRVTWWRPGWGERHPGIMLVNGATALGNDDPETVRLAEALARAGYLVMLPEFPFIQEGRLEPRAPEIIDAAFGRALSLPDTAGMPVSAFGFSVGGGMLLAAASRPGALEQAAYVGVLGAYFDLDTYLASVVTGAQVRDGRQLAWDPDPLVRLRLPIAAAEALSDDADRAPQAGEPVLVGHLEHPGHLGRTPGMLVRAALCTCFLPALHEGTGLVRPGRGIQAGGALG